MGISPDDVGVRPDDMGVHPMTWGYAPTTWGYAPTDMGLRPDGLGPGLALGVPHPPRIIEIIVEFNDFRTPGGPETIGFHRNPMNSIGIHWIPIGIQ